MIISETSLSSAINIPGLVPDKKFFQSIGSKVVDWLEAPLASAAQLLRNMKDGAIEVVRSIRNGTFGKIFGQWAKDDPVGAAAGPTLWLVDRLAIVTKISLIFRWSPQA